MDRLDLVVKVEIREANFMAISRAESTLKVDLEKVLKGIDANDTDADIFTMVTQQILDVVSKADMVKSPVEVK